MTRRQSKDPLEFYETPSHVVREIVPHLPSWSTVLDPCAGQGALLQALGDDNIRIGIEIDEKRYERLSSIVGVEALHRDAFAEDNLWLWERADLIIMNAGFSQAQRFTEHALAHAKRGATVASLVRLAFLETPGRAVLLRKHPPDVFVFARRPSFTGDGKSDRSAICWLVWGPGRGNRWYLLDGKREPDK